MEINWGLILCIALPLGLGGLSGWLTRNETRGPWYTSLQKPPWMPPRYLFGPVWTVLYVLMGIACWRVWKAGGRTQPMALYILQLALNVAWSLLFFNAKSLSWAMFDVLALLGAVVAMATSFYKVDPVAAYLIAPYIAWVAFATALTASLYARNPDRR